jgi:large subunit ribosomal protein L21
VEALSAKSPATFQQRHSPISIPFPAPGRQTTLGKSPTLHRKQRKNIFFHPYLLAKQEEMTTFAANYSVTGQKKRATKRLHPPGQPTNLPQQMYAIVEINGQQFKAEAGKKLFVHHIQGAENGNDVEFEKVLLVDKDGNITVGTPTVAGAKVIAQVISPLVKGDKVLVFHKKRRKGYRKLNGHRQQFTEISIKEIVA